MKRIISVLIILMMVTVMVSCGDDDLIGSWIVKDQASMASVMVTFTDEKMDLFGMEVAYETKNNQIVIAFMGQEQKIDYKVKGDVLTLEVEGQALEFERVKEK